MVSSGDVTILNLEMAKITWFFGRLWHGRAVDGQRVRASAPARL
ncbi:MAG: hypothetical protein Q7N95_07545 [Alphaproteobacteria bacterium]|nr:hypothetical protein [Alphaproteobacteria bacterium]